MEAIGLFSGSKLVAKKDEDGGNVIYTQITVDFQNSKLSDEDILFLNDKFKTELLVGLGSTWRSSRPRSSGQTSIEDVIPLSADKPLEVATEPDHDEPELLFGLFDARMVKSAPDYWDDDGNRFFVRSEQIGVDGELKTFYGYYCNDFDIVVRVDGTEQFENSLLAEEGLAKWAEERGYEAVVPDGFRPIYKDFKSDSGIFFVQADHVSFYIARLFNDECAQWGITRSNYELATQDMEDATTKFMLSVMCYVSEEWEGFTAPSASDVSTEESDSVVDAEPATDATEDGLRIEDLNHLDRIKHKAAPLVYVASHINLDEGTVLLEEEFGDNGSRSIVVSAKTLHEHYERAV